jgi:hypothetical protein
VVLVTNNNSAPLKITAVAQGSTSGETSPGAGCLPSEVSVVPRSDLSIPLPAGTSEVTLPDVLRLSATAPDPCQGGEFTKRLRLTAVPNGN